MADLQFEASQEKLWDGSLVAVIKLNGTIEAKTVTQFENRLDELFDQGIKYLVLNFTDVTYVNSSGLGFLVHVADRTDEIGGVICLVSIHPKISSLFTMMGIDDLFSILNNESEALRFISETFITSSAKLPSVSSQYSSNKESQKKVPPEEEKVAIASESQPPKVAAVSESHTPSEAVSNKEEEEVPKEEEVVPPAKEKKKEVPDIQKAPEPIPSPSKASAVKRTSPVRPVPPMPLGKGTAPAKTSVFQRKISAYFYKQIYTLKPFPLRVEITAPPSQREEKIEHRTLSVITIIPHFPECQVRPSKVNVDVSHNEATASFAIAAPRAGQYEGWLKIDCRGRQIKALKLTTKITKHPVDMIILSCVILFPIVALILNTLGSNVKGLPAYGFISGGIFLIIGVFLYLQRYPRKASPIEKLFLVPPASIKRRQDDEQ